MPQSKERHAEYLKKRYKEDLTYRDKHKQLVKRNNEKYKIQARQLVADFKKSGCAKCPEKEPCCLSAHHLRDKKFNISTAISNRAVPSAIARELAKCICLCENCHRKVHAGLLKL